MDTRTITIEHNGATFTGQIGTVERTYLGFHEHYGIATANLDLRLADGYAIGIGGYTLDGKPEGRPHRPGTAFGMDHVLTILRTVGVSAWEDLRGKQVIVLFDKPGFSGRSVGLAHLTDPSHVMVFAEHAEQWLDTDKTGVVAFDEKSQTWVDVEN